MQMRFLIPLAFFILLGVFLAIGLTLEPRKLPSALIDKKIPAFSLTTLASADDEVTEQELFGYVSLVNVWATWCASCRYEHDVLMSIHQRYQIPIYGLNYKDERKKARAWLEQFGNPYRMNFFDGDGRVAIDLGVYGTPETFIVDADGVIRYKHVGPVDLKVWQETLYPIILGLQEKA